MLVSLFRLLDPPPTNEPVGTVTADRIAIPIEGSRIALEPARITPTAPLLRGRIVFHPRYEQFLRKCGIDSPQAALNLPGEIIGGHPDRHVCRVEVQNGRARKCMFLKREHLVPVRVKLRNQRAGFGWVSRSEREAVMLKHLEATGLPGPQWLAYGEDGNGRAFLLIDELTGSVDIRTALSDNALSQPERDELIDRAAAMLATIHQSGVTTPELAAKHLFVNPNSQSVALVDWQSALIGHDLAQQPIARQLATLHASLAPELLPARDRLRFLIAYVRLLRSSSKTVGKFKPLLRQIQALSGKLSNRSSIRDQQPTQHDQRLVWLAGETVCAIPEVAAVWPTPADRTPFYSSDSLDGERNYAEEWITFANGRRALLTRFRTNDPVGRLISKVRERPWRSPAAKAARVLFHLARHGIPGPKLLAFGQKLQDSWIAESFLLQDPLENPVPIAVRVAELAHDQHSRTALLQECGALLRRIHNAGLMLVAGCTGRSVFQISHNSNTGVSLESPLAVEFVKRISERTRRTDLRLLIDCELASLSRSDRMRVVRGYLGQTDRDRQSLHLLSAGVV